MVGGYMSFTGIDAKARFGETAIKDVLPITMIDKDDRVEKPAGIIPEVIDSEHPVLKGIPTEWPKFLGYNKTVARDNCPVLATIGGDPFVAVGEFGNLLSLVLTVHLTGVQKNLLIGNTIINYGLICLIG